MVAADEIMLTQQGIGLLRSKSSRKDQTLKKICVQVVKLYRCKFNFRPCIEM